MTWLRTEERGPVRWLVMDNPGRRNAIPPSGWLDLARAFEDFDESDQRVLVLTGAGGDFCAGADLDPSAGITGAGVVERTLRMKQVAEAAGRLHRLTKPTVAAVDGVAVGGGMNLAIGCDVVVASDRARFSEIFVRRGLVPDAGGSWLLPRLVGPQRAKELALTGRIVEADEALRIGLCLEVVEASRLKQRATEIAESFLAGAPAAQMLAKQMIDHAWDVSYPEALSWEGQSQAICFATEDAEEGIAAFREKRPPEWKGR